jgi:hypothetical protein
MQNPNETSLYFRLASELAAARQAGCPERLALAVDELEVMAMHSENPKLADRARLALAA